MRRHATFLITILASFLCACSPGSSTKTNMTGAHSVDLLDWMEGCWSTPDGSVREIWSEGVGGWRFGYGFVLNDGDVVFFEQLRIETVDDQWRYIASPAGGPATVFTADNVGASRVTFVNAEHDYPQRIAYWREGDTLFAEISALEGENAHRFDKQLCR